MQEHGAAVLSALSTLLGTGVLLQHACDVAQLPLSFGGLSLQHGGVPSSFVVGRSELQQLRLTGVLKAAGVVRPAPILLRRHSCFDQPPNAHNLYGPVPDVKDKNTHTVRHTVAKARPLQFMHRALLPLPVPTGPTRSPAGGPGSQCPSRFAGGPIPSKVHLTPPLAYAPDSIPSQSPRRSFFDPFNDEDVLRQGLPHGALYARPFWLLSMASGLGPLRGPVWRSSCVRLPPQASTCPR